jgi:two-component system chemotaxis response regulator CheY
MRRFKMDGMRVMIADDEFHVRTVLRAIVNGIPGSVVGEAENGKDVLEKYREVLPDLLLLDINMPLKTGDLVIAELMEDYPEARVIMLTGVADSATVEKCIEAGACGYIRKDTPSEEMRDLIRTIMAD